MRSTRGRSCCWLVLLVGVVAWEPRGVDCTSAAAPLPPLPPLAPLAAPPPPIQSLPHSPLKASWGINAGSPTPVRGVESGIYFYEDPLPPATPTSSAFPAPGTPPQPPSFLREAVDRGLYLAGRRGEGGMGPGFNYTFGGLWPGLYTVELHFVEATWPYEGARQFSVAVNGDVRVAALDVFKEAGGKEAPLVMRLRGCPAVGGAVVVSFGLPDGLNCSSAFYATLECVPFVNALAVIPELSLIDHALRLGLFVAAVSAGLSLLLHLHRDAHFREKANATLAPVWRHLTPTPSPPSTPRAPLLPEDASIALIHARGDMTAQTLCHDIKTSVGWSSDGEHLTCGVLDAPERLQQCLWERHRKLVVVVLSRWAVSQLASPRWSPDAEVAQLLLEGVETACKAQKRDQFLLHFVFVDIHKEEFKKMHFPKKDVKNVLRAVGSGKGPRKWPDSIVKLVVQAHPCHFGTTAQPLLQTISALLEHHVVAR